MIIILQKYSPSHMLITSMFWVLAYIRLDIIKFCGSIRPVGPLWKCLLENTENVRHIFICLLFVMFFVIYNNNYYCLV